MTGKQFLYIMIATFVTTLFWVALNIIHSQSQVQIPPETQELMAPIDPNFDKDVINEL